MSPAFLVSVILTLLAAPGIAPAFQPGGRPAGQPAARQAFVAKAFSTVDNCRTCHTELGDEASKQFSGADIHAAAGVTCAGCHGGDPAAPEMEDAMSPASGFVEAAKMDIAGACARCHSDPELMRGHNPGLPVDQLEKYRTSVHGKRHAAGDRRVAVCSSCHGSHGILPAVDSKSSVNPLNISATCASCHADAERMAHSGLPTSQYDEYRGSVHGRSLHEGGDMAAPTCNDCHGNHGAAPPEVSSVSEVCGSCHAFNRALFSQSPHAKAFAELELPGCETCHGNHDIIRATDDLLGTADQAVCVRCHSADDRPEGFRAAGLMRGLIDSLAVAAGEADSLVRVAESLGMDAAEARYRLRDVKQSRLEARTTVHAFNPDTLRRVVAAGLATATGISAEGEKLVDDHYFRRHGLGISTLIISMVALALWLKIRRIERDQASKA
jgi:predicted CXXCH cytochrome family protein